MIESQQHSNIDESEMGQLHALHLNENAIAKVRASMPKGPSLTVCEDCGDDIPVERQLAVQGCTTCIYCKTRREKK